MARTRATSRGGNKADRKRTRPAKAAGAKGGGRDAWRTRKVYAAFGNWDEAVELAKKYKRGPDRRRDLGQLLARAGRWEDLRELLSGVQTPEEACETAWWVAAALEGLSD